MRRCLKWKKKSEGEIILIKTDEQLIFRTYKELSKLDGKKTNQL